MTKYNLNADISTEKARHIGDHSNYFVLSVNIHLGDRTECVHLRMSMSDYSRLKAQRIEPLDIIHEAAKRICGGENPKFA